MESLWYLQLQAAHGIGPAKQRAILRAIRAEHTDLQTFFSRPSPDWQRAGLNQRDIQALQDAAALAQQWQQKLDAKNVDVIGALDPRYPERLHRILGEQAPFALCVWGNLSLLAQPAVSFCGSRKTTERGLEVARDIARQVAEAGWSVVSGHAQGIDTATHRAALEHGSTTVIVAPEGILNFRLRREIKALATRENTLVLSEFPPHARWSVANAMTRNRTICGMSDALVVVQSGEKGGTFEAGKFALQVRIPLFVAEYAQSDANGPGNPYFLRAGAHSLRRHNETGHAVLDALFREVHSHYENLHTSSDIDPRLVQTSFLRLWECEPF